MYNILLNHLQHQSYDKNSNNSDTSTFLFTVEYTNITATRTPSYNNNPNGGGGVEHESSSSSSHTSQETQGKEVYNQLLYKMDTYATIGLSSVSCISLLFFTFIYIDAQIKLRDHLKETKKSAFKKIFRHEYLVFSYCLSLFFSHLFSIAQKALIKFYIDGMKT